jgi:hypothetical protein
MLQIQWVTVPKLKGFLGKGSDHFRVTDHSSAKESTHKNALNLTEEKVLQLIDPRAGLSSVRSNPVPGGKIVLEQRINTFASKTPFCLRIRSTNRLRPAMSSVPRGS